MSKKIKDTKLGQWLASNAPVVFNTVAQALPEKGLTGIVKNIILKPDSHVSPEKQIEFANLEKEFELEMEQEMTLRILGHQELEKVQLQQDDNFTKRARPTRQYFWLLFLLICYPIAFFVDGSFIEIPEIILIGIFSDFGLYSWKRSEEKKERLKLGMIK